MNKFKIIIKLLKQGWHATVWFREIEKKTCNTNEYWSTSSNCK